MKTFVSVTCSFVLLAAHAQAGAQSFCASDGLPTPMRLIERFINADCGSCWSDSATPRQRPGTVALDWVIPGGFGEDAPLSAVATRDALARLASLKKSIPAQSLAVLHSVQPIQGATLRVAHGLPVADYVGASIEFKPILQAAKNQRWTSWLALVETLAAGSEGSPVERNLVRNLLQTHWNGGKQLSNIAQNRFFESRSMSIAAVTNPARLRVIGWVENAKGQVVGAAQSHCLI